MNTRQLAAALSLAAVAALMPQAHAHGDAHANHAQPPEQKAWGIAGDAKGARTIEIQMGDDMRFRPDRIEVREGETVRLVVRNAGKVLHELVLGTPAELKEHAALMKKFPKMEHGDAYMTHVKPGAKGEVVWNFNRAGTFQFACLIPGHFEAGMVGTVVVAPGTSSSGEVRKVDKATGKVTLRHGEIRNLDMPPMTMVFTATPRALVDKLKAGDKVDFTAAKNAAGDYIVTAIEKRK